MSLVTDTKTVSSLTVASNLRLSRADPEKVLVRFPELTGHRRRRVGELSGGQQQMLSVGIALARQPKVLLADELSLGLAPLVVARLLEAVRDAADEGVAVLLVEQHVRDALRIADRVYVMRDGRIAMAGTASEIAERGEELERHYLAVSADDDPRARTGSPDLRNSSPFAMGIPPALARHVRAVPTAAPLRVVVVTGAV